MLYSVVQGPMHVYGKENGCMKSPLKLLVYSSSSPFTDHKGVGDADDSYTYDGIQNYVEVLICCLFSMQIAVEQVEIQVPIEKVGLIIEKGGEIIKNMQTRSGARIQVVDLFYSFDLCLMASDD